MGRAAYRKLSLKWHPDRNHGCGKHCEEMMSDITKAFDLIKKRAAPPPVDRSWQGWAMNIVQDWQNLIEAFTSEDGPPRKRHAKNPKKVRGLVATKNAAQEAIVLPLNSG